MDDERRTTETPSAAATRPQSLVLELAKLGPGPSVFAGDLSALHPPDLLNFLHQGRRTGVLFAVCAEVERAVVLIDGAIAWSASTHPAERFGELVCRLGIVSRSAVAAVLEEQAKMQPQRRLGELLVERGLIDKEMRARALRHQVIEIFLGLLVLREGRFNFRAGFDAARLPSRLSLDIEGLLLDGLRRLDETEHYRTRIASASVVPQRSDLACPAADGESFSPEMRRLLEQVDGARPLSELAELAALGEFEATKAAFRLMESGHLVPLGEAPKSDD